MKGRIFGFITVIISLLVLATPSAFAQSAPIFSTCSNPSGTVIANYSDGTHGIAGDSSTYTGSDTVYNVNDSQDLQCFCGNGNGIATNWWKIGDMSFQEISQWEKQGWTYIPDGSAWGLDASAYLAYNSTYSCGGSSSNSNNGGSGSGTGDGLSDGRSDGRSSCPQCTEAPKNNQNVLGTVSNDVSNSLKVLGGATDKTSGIDLTKSVCGACLWWPMLLGEIVLLTALYLYAKKKNLKFNRLLLGGLIAVLAYIVFLIFNKGHVCPLGNINLWIFSLPCRYFWVFDIAVFALLSWIIRNSRPKSPSKKKK